jgi:hypothetical protein
VSCISPKNEKYSTKGFLCQSKEGFDVFIFDATSKTGIGCKLFLKMVCKSKIVDCLNKINFDKN